jgi:hypothetical protein
MAPGDSIPPDRVIYRGVPWSRIDRKSKQPKDTAFLLRPASEHFGAEDSLSFGLTPAAALNGLKGVSQTCQLKVSDILGLGRGLTVLEGDAPEYVQVSGMPKMSDDEGLALAIAKDLRGKASACS